MVRQIFKNLKTKKEFTSKILENILRKELT